jgi:hypothetical protein
VDGTFPATPAHIVASTSIFRKPAPASFIFVFSTVFLRPWPFMSLVQQLQHPVKAEGREQQKSTQAENQVRSPKSKAHSAVRALVLPKVSIPASDQAWRWVYSSCNGFDVLTASGRQLRDIEPLWLDLLAQHEGSGGPFHLVAANGDQVRGYA